MIPPLTSLFAEAQPHLAGPDRRVVSVGEKPPYLRFCRPGFVRETKIGLYYLLRALLYNRLSTVPGSQELALKPTREPDTHLTLKALHHYSRTPLPPS